MAKGKKPDIHFLWYVLLAFAVFGAGVYLGRQAFSYKGEAGAGGSASNTAQVQNQPAPERCPGVEVGAPFHFTIHNDDAAVPVYYFQIFAPVPAQKGDAPMPACIEVTKGSNDAAPQVLKGFYAEPLILTRVSDALQHQDANFDGYQDIRLVSGVGATGNASYNFWLFNKDTGRFDFNQDLSDLIDPVLHPANNQITTHMNNGCAGECFVDGTYIFEDGKLVPIKTVTQDTNDDGQTFIRVTKERRNGVMEVVSTETIKANQ